MLVVFGSASVAQTVLSLHNYGDFLSINWGWVNTIKCHQMSLVTHQSLTLLCLSITLCRRLLGLRHTGSSSGRGISFLKVFNCVFLYSFLYSSLTFWGRLNALLWGTLPDWDTHPWSRQTVARFAGAPDGIIIIITVICHQHWISPELVSATFQRTPLPGFQESHREGWAASSWTIFYS